MNTTTLVAIFVCVFAAAIPYVTRMFIFNRFNNVVNKGNYDKGLEILDGRLFKLLMGEVSTEWNRLKIYLTQNDLEKIEDQTNKLLTMKMNKDQTYAVCSSVFFFFIDSENQAMARKVLDYMKPCTSQEEYDYDSAMYRVIIEKKSEDIDYINNLIKDNAKALQAPKNALQAGLLQYMLGLQYMYQDNKKEALVHFNRAKNDLKGTPYHKKVKKIIEQY